MMSMAIAMMAMLRSRSRSGDAWTVIRSRPWRGCLPIGRGQLSTGLRKRGSRARSTSCKLQATKLSETRGRMRKKRPVVGHRHRRQKRCITSIFMTLFCVSVSHRAFVVFNGLSIEMRIIPVSILLTPDHFSFSSFYYVSSILLLVFLLSKQYNLKQFAATSQYTSFECITIDFSGHCLLQLPQV